MYWKLESGFKFDYTVILINLSSWLQKTICVARKNIPQSCTTIHENNI